MEQRLSLVTLAVEDVGRAVGFYRDGLGWRPHMVTEEVAFFQLNGIGLGLYRRDLMAEELEVPVSSLVPGGSALAYNVRDRPEVDEVVALAGRAGGRILKTPTATSWGGHSGYFADLDGHRWEVAWNPAWPLDARGDLRMDA